MGEEEGKVEGKADAREGMSGEEEERRMRKGRRGG